MSVTISDVAKRAGVSTSTVSKVINKSSTISEETVQRVKRAIEELDYTPNSKAVHFARGTSKNIIYLTDMSAHVAYDNPHMFDIMSGVYHELSAMNYTMTIEGISGRKFPGENACDEIKNKSADGLIIHGSASNSDLFDALSKNNIPHIIIGHPEDRKDLCWIDTDHAAAGQYAADYVFSCGYRNPAFVAGRKEDKISNNRLTGFRQGLINHGLHLKTADIIYTEDSQESACQKTNEYLSHSKKPDILVIENSLLAFGAARAIRKCKLSIPEDISLLTFDIYPYSQLIEPKPSVIDINMFELGAQAGRMMIQKLNNPALLIQSFTSIPMLQQGESTR